MRELIKLQHMMNRWLSLLRHSYMEVKFVSGYLYVCYYILTLYDFLLQDKDASRHNVTVDLPKEKNVTESNKEQKMAKGTNAKEILKLTRDGSAGNDRKGYLNFQETSLLGHASSPPWAYFVNMLIGILLFVVVIWGVVICGNYWC